MKATSQRAFRAWAFVNVLILLAILLPGVLGHPYPSLIRPYVQWGGLLFYVLSGLSFVAVARRRKSTEATTKPRL
jgi:hypothetical protein